MLMPRGRVRSVVTEEKDERVFGDAKFVELIQHVTERFVHPFDQRGERLGVSRLSRVLVVLGEARIRFERAHEPRSARNRGRKVLRPRPFRRRASLPRS